MPTLRDMLRQRAASKQRRTFRETFVFDLDLGAQLAAARADLEAQEAALVRPDGTKRAVRMAGSPLHLARSIVAELEQRAQASAAVAIFTIPAADDFTDDLAELAAGISRTEGVPEGQLVRDYLRRVLLATFTEWRTVDDEPTDELDKSDLEQILAPGVLEPAEFLPIGYQVAEALRNPADIPKLSPL